MKNFTKRCTYPIQPEIKFFTQWDNNGQNFTQIAENIKSLQEGTENFSLSDF